MRTAAPVASMSLIAALCATIVWQAINLWRPHHFAMPTAPGTNRLERGAANCRAGDDPILFVRKTRRAGGRRDGVTIFCPPG